MISRSAPAVVTSCIGAQQLVEEAATAGSTADGCTFPIVVLDEAAQTTEPALLTALSAAKARQIILVGDTRQLPPTVSSTCPELRQSLSLSPMARLEECGVDEVSLSEQYRMPPVLLEYPSDYFYDGKLRCADLFDGQRNSPPRGFAWPKGQPLAFVNVGNGDCEVSQNLGSKSNPTEAELVVNIVFELLAGGEVKENSIAVISPYSKQVQLIRTELDNKRKGLDELKVGTVDSFQGQETDVVIFSAVRSNPLNELGFLRDSRRLCVAITRAKKGLIVVGDKNCLRSCRHWEELIKSCERRSCILGPKDWSRTEELMREASSARASQGSDQLFSLDTSDELLGLFDKDDDMYGLFDDDDDDY